MASNHRGMRRRREFATKATLLEYARAIGMRTVSEETNIYDLRAKVVQFEREQRTHEKFLRASGQGGQ